MNGQQDITLDTISENLKKNKEVSLIVSNSWATRNITLIPKDGKVGMMMRYEWLSLNKEFQKKLPLGESIVLWIKETYNGSVMTLVFLSDMLHGLIAPTTPEEREDAKNMLSWPIGVGHTFVALVENKAGVQVICIIIALLSINLWVINLLPFPALDGGRFITTTLYSFLWLFGKWKTLFLKIEKYFHAIGFILLLILMLYVAGIDISRFF
jgi:regulator of sigma E protease